MNPKRIVITARLYGAGGIETHLLNLSRTLVERGAEVTLVTRYANRDTPILRERRNIPIRFLSTPFSGNLRWFRLSTLWAMAVWPTRLRYGSFDVLYSPEVSRFTPFLRRFVRRDGYVIASGAGEPLSERSALDPTGRQVLSGFIAESELQAEAVRRLHRELPVAVVPHMGFFRALPRQQRPLTNGLRVAFLGRYARAKGIYRLLDLWPELGIGPARLDFYGHGPEKDELQREIRRRGFENQVSVNDGWSTGEELSSVLTNTDLLVLPSETEGLPLVLLEAMAHGVPFVASDVGAVRTLAEDNPDVRMVPLENAALARGITAMAAAIRAGRISGARLQQYHQRRYSAEGISNLWAQALLEPETFWGPQRQDLPAQQAPACSCR